jgi:hypothetical protein
MGYESLPVAEGPTKSRAGAIVALRKRGRRASVPASVERKVPREIIDELDVIDSVRIEMETSSVCDCRKQRGRDIQVRLFEFKGFDFGCDETNCSVICSLFNRILSVADILPTQSSHYVYTRPVGIL